MLSAMWGLVAEEGGDAEALPDATVRGRVGEGGAGDRESCGREVDGRCILTACDAVGKRQNNRRHRPILFEDTDRFQGRACGYVCIWL